MSRPDNALNPFADDVITSMIEQDLAMEFCKEHPDLSWWLDTASTGEVIVASKTLAGLTALIAANTPPGIIEQLLDVAIGMVAHAREEVEREIREEESG